MMVEGNNEGNKDEKKNAFVQEFHEHGMRCGNDIASVAKEIHPNAIAIIPLYRSCIVLEKDEEDLKNGTCSIHAYGDPHWMNSDITLENVKRDDFHSKFVAYGKREGPDICLVEANNYQKAVNDLRK